MNWKPYEFGEVKAVVETLLGAVDEHALPSFEAVTERMHWKEMMERIHIDAKGISCEIRGRQVFGYLYIEKGYPKPFKDSLGQDTIVPKFHAAACSTIEDMRAAERFRGYYVFSTTPVSLLDVDGQPKDPRLCRNCLALRPELGRITTTAEFCAWLNKGGSGRNHPLAPRLGSGALP